MEIVLLIGIFVFFLAPRPHLFLWGHHSTCVEVREQQAILGIKLSVFRLPTSAFAHASNLVYFNKK